jgi:hypothetical protein
MLGKYKGFNVPEKDKELFDRRTPDIFRRFCYGSKESDCHQLSCSECLFNPRAEKTQEAAFSEWYAVKGKVAYA